MARAELVPRLSHPPVLAHFEKSKEIIVQTDASFLGLGVVLMQGLEEGLRPVIYLSRRLMDAESRYHANELECLAVVWALKKLRSYVYGRCFKVKTHCSAVGVVMMTQP